jgi:ankyrin repeat protein
VDLFEAIENGDGPTAVALVTADPNLARSTGDQGQSPVLHAMYQWKFDIARALATQITADGGALDLAEASALDDVERVTSLLAGGAPVDGRTADGFTPLQLAAYFGATAAARLLIAAGADVDAVADNPMRIRPLHAAAAGRHTAVALALIAAGADVNGPQQHGWTPLHTAAHNGDAVLVDALIGAGALVEATNDDGNTARSLAVAADHPEMARLLS